MKNYMFILASTPPNRVKCISYLENAFIMYKKIKFILPILQQRILPYFASKHFSAYIILFFGVSCN